MHLIFKQKFLYNSPPDPQFLTNITLKWGPSNNFKSDFWHFCKLQLYLSALISQRNFWTVDGFLVIAEVRQHTAGACVKNILIQCRTDVYWIYRFFQKFVLYIRNKKPVLLKYFCLPVGICAVVAYENNSVFFFVFEIRIFEKQTDYTQYIRKFK